MIQPDTVVQGYTLSDALSGLSAYDDGAVQSGIRDERLRAHVREIIRALPADESRILLSKIARDLFLTDEAIEQGYGIADAASFYQWLEGEGMAP